MSLQEVDVVGVSHADADPSRLRAPCSRDKAVALSREHGDREHGVVGQGGGRRARHTTPDL